MKLPAVKAAKNSDTTSAGSASRRSASSQPFKQGRWETDSRASRATSVGPSSTRSGERERGNETEADRTIAWVDGVGRKLHRDTLLAATKQLVADLIPHCTEFEIFAQNLRFNCTVQFKGLQAVEMARQFSDKARDNPQEWEDPHTFEKKKL